ncbi:TetR/AcrR family transcriptional regulator [Rhodopseudomonas palustris]|uniref:TetR/AcrR family transcriptional regulator n=1 Tax=Rhodopseudomonas palustris TaxID=1076 RepID=A0A323UJR2_RHOPL|nr:TetR/AcrR family transcriptional regulator [Rhodopseudomonas palustris]PZA12353.1 TetR/AcrR family transcriptional regulator [Rhodopseudomonas palustris]
MTEQLLERKSREEGAPKRGARPPIDKFNARRIELAEAALETLAEIGYARTSLREIAQKSEFSHGVLHYYFSDKFDLICCSVRYYKGKCVTRYDQITSTARSREELLDGFLSKLGETMRSEARMHRLWYDLRAQALFETAFRDDVTAIDKSLEDMVWRVVSRFSELGGKTPAMSPESLYAVFDGLFQKYLLRHLSGDAQAIPDLQAELRRLLPMIG